LAGGGGAAAWWLSSWRLSSARLLLEFGDPPLGAGGELTAGIAGTLHRADQVAHAVVDLVQPPLDGLLLSLVLDDRVVGCGRQARRDQFGSIRS
jgi:hypothetical protein